MQSSRWPFVVVSIATAMAVLAPAGASSAPVPTTPTMPAAVEMAVEAAVHPVPAGSARRADVDVAPRQGPPGWLEIWNTYRAQSGLPPVREDPAKSDADRQHTEYLLLNGRTGHGQDPGEPGATPAGAEAGASSNVWTAFGFEPTAAEPIEAWLSGPFHNVGMLRPDLVDVGFALTGDASRGYAAAAWVFPEEFTPPDPARYPILFPGDGATMPITDSCCESPQPVTACPGYADATGLILTAQLIPPSYPDPAGEPIITASSLRRVGPDVADLEHCLVRGAEYSNPDPGAQQTGRALMSGGAYIVPRQPLQDGATYEAVIAFDGREVRWSFTVGPLPGLDEVPPPAVPVPAGPARPLVAETAVDLAVAASRERFGDGAADLVVLSRDDDFADALAGTPLLADGPLLFTSTADLPDAVAAELRRVLPPGGEVVVLGGDAAVSPEVRAQVAAMGYSVTRIAGATRILTAAAAAQRVAGPGGAPTVALARAFGTDASPSAAWADSISAGAWLTATGTPLLLTPTGSLAPEVAQALNDMGVTSTVLLGGEAAISAAVAAAVPGARRVAGPTRAATAVAIADELVGRRAGAVLVDGFAAEGWVAGLTAAGLAADRHAPVLLSSDTGLPPETADAVRGCRDALAELLLVGRSGAVAAAQQELLAMAEAPACAQLPSGITLAGSGLGSDLPFGTPEEEALDVLTAELGAPDFVSDPAPVCPGGGGAMRSTAFFGQGMSVSFLGGSAPTLESWSYQRLPDGTDPFGLATPTGIGLSSTSADIAAAYAGRAQQLTATGSFTDFWFVEPIEGGTLIIPVDGPQPSARVQALHAELPSCSG